MKVVKKSIVKVNSLRDYFVKNLSSLSENRFSVTKDYVVDGNNWTVGGAIEGDYFVCGVAVFNEQAGVDLGIRLYEINLFDDEPKSRIRLPEPVCNILIETLETYECGVSPLGSGVITDSILNDDESVAIKIWIGGDLNYISISRKDMNPTEEDIGEEYLLDKLGL